MDHALFLDFLLLLFILGFLRYEMAEECADDDDAKEAIFHLRRDVLEELKLHNSFVEVRDSFVEEKLRIGFLCIHLFIAI